MRSICQAPGCERPHYALGYCSMHRQRMKRYGSLERPAGNRGQFEGFRHSAETRSKMGAAHRVHGQAGATTRTPEYNAWRQMKNRCYRKGHVQWKDWGGRGITVCDEWRHDFERFLRDVGPRPGPDFSIDRIDNDGNYEPGNVRWATRLQQVHNRRNSRRAG